MSFTLHINGATVVTDSVAELTALIEALKLPAAPPAQPGRPPAPARVRPRQPDPVLEDEPESDLPFAPMYPSWDRASLKIGDVQPAPRPLPPPAVRMREGLLPSIAQPPAQPADKIQVADDHSTHSLPPAPPPAEPPPAAAPAHPRAHISPGCIFLQGTRHVLEISVDGRHNRRGSFKTREAAEAAQEQTYQARLKGEPIPEFDNGRRCRRCLNPGHTVLRCKAETPAPRPPARAPGERRCRRCGDVGHSARWKHGPDGRALPKPVTFPVGSPEHRAKIGETLRRAAAARREASGLPPLKPKLPPAPNGSDEHRQRVSEAMTAVWERRRAAKLPPRCVRCLRVGHVEADCPKPAPGFGGTAVGIVGPSFDSRKQEHLARGEPSTSTATDGGEPARGMPTQVIQQDGPDPSTYGADDDEGTDLTDLVDAAEPPAPEVHFGGPTLVTPPPPVDLPRALVHLPLIEDEGAGAEEIDPADYDRPVTRGDCKGQARPCPFVSCADHVYPIAVMEARRGSPFYGLEPWQLPETCTLDVADRGGATLEEVGAILGITRERIRQIEEKALARMKLTARRHRMDFEEPIDQRSHAASDVAPFSNARGKD